MNDILKFWNSSILWERECRKELRKKKFNPSLWNFCTDGSIIQLESPYRRVKNIVTPWKESPYYVKLVLEEKG